MIKRDLSLYLLYVLYESPIMKKRHPYIKFISLVLVQAFALQQCAFAAPGLSLALKPSIQTQTFQIPASIASVDDIYQAKDQKKTIYLIQDAHTNESGQMNVSRILSHLFDKEDKLQYVFMEAGQGNESLSFLRELTTLENRKRTAKTFMKRGKLQGPEYFDLTSNHDSILWGVEDMGLYSEAWDAYKAVYGDRSSILQYLDKISTTINVLKPKIYNRQLLEFDLKVQDYNRDKATLSEYIKRLVQYTKPRNQYPNINAFTKLSKIESAINFEKANQQLAQICVQYPSSCEFTKKIDQVNKSHYQDQIGFFLKLQDELTEKGMLLNKAYPELFQYGQYIENMNKINFRQLLEEMDSLQGDIYQSFQQNQAEANLYLSSIQIGYLKNSFNSN